MDPDEELFGVPRLCAALQGKSEEPLDEIQKVVLESVENFARGARQADDLTMLVVRYRGTGSLSVTETDVSATKEPASASS